MKKITAKTTKMELVNIIGANVAKVAEVNKDLFDRIAYADKMFKEDESKVTKKDLIDLVNEVVKVLGDDFVEPTPKAEPKAENSVKKTLKSKKAEKKVEEPTEEPTEQPKEEPTKEEPKKAEKKTAKKSLSKKKEQPKDGATSSESGNVQKIFPDTLEVSGTTYRLAPEVKTMEDLLTAYENGEEIMLACYWTKEHLREFPYFNHMLGKPKSFPNDLDLTTMIWVSPEKRVSYHVSRYTEGCYNILPEDLEEDDGIRYAGMMEFQIYKPM